VTVVGHCRYCTSDKDSSWWDWWRR